MYRKSTPNSLYYGHFETCVRECVSLVSHLQWTRVKFDDKFYGHTFNQDIKSVFFTNISDLCDLFVVVPHHKFRNEVFNLGPI